jgi:hypothetical protein
VERTSPVLEFDHRDVVLVGEREDAFAGVRGAVAAMSAQQGDAAANGASA